MEKVEDKLVKRLDALLGIAMTRLGDPKNASLAENVRYLRSLDFTNGEIAAILGKSVHHIEVEVSKLVRQGKVSKLKGE